MIYLDNAATAIPNGEAVKQAEKFLTQDFYNPSSLYRAGFSAHKAIEDARKFLLSRIASPANFELIFTGSGSEGDNQALFCAAGRGNVVTTSGEHAAVYNSTKELSLRGTEVRYARLNADGSVDIDDLLSKVDEKTTLVSVIHVNNETGAVNDVNTLAAEVKKVAPSCVFHSDGVQAFGKIIFTLSPKIDLYTVSAHKIGGIRGIAALYKNKRLHLKPYIHGGGQENGLRSGTENTFAIKQFEYAAADKFSSIGEDFARVSGYNSAVRDGLDKEIFSVLSSENASPYILSVTAAGLRGEVLLHMLDDAELMVGTGSACSSKNRYSRVMLACGLNEKRADGVLRISFSPRNTQEEITGAIGILNSCAAKLRENTK